MRDELIGKVAVGDVMALVSGRDWDQLPTPVRVRKVWKNGVVEIGNLDPEDTGRGRLFNPDSMERGGIIGHRSRIRLLEKGETAESLLAARKATALASTAERDREKQEREKAVAEWWRTEGRAMWEGRTVLPHRMFGLEVAVVRFIERDEERMPFVVVEHEKNWDGHPEVCLTVGGLVGRAYDDKHSISTYSSSTVRGATLEEVLYDMTH